MPDSDPAPTIENLLARRAWVRGIARSLVADESRVDDAEQETWVAAMESPPTKSGSIAAWLRRVVTSRAVDAHRSESRRAAREVASARPEGSPSTETLVAKAEIQRDVAAAVCALEEPYRTAVLLRYFEEMEPRDVAARLGVPIETVRTRLKRAHEMLRARLDREYGGGRRAWCVLLVPLMRPRRSVPVGTAVGGALIMAGTKKMLAIAAVVALLAAGTWWIADSASKRASHEAPRDLAVALIAAPARTQAATDAPPPPDDEGGKSSVSVDVADTAGRPVAGARVEIAVLVPDHPNVADETNFLGVAATAARVSAVRAASTSADGSVEVSGLTAGDSRIRVAAAGYALHEERLTVGGSVHRRRIVLRPGCVLTGRVLRSDGSPARGAEVVLAEQRATSDATGLYRFDALPPGTHDVRVRDVSGMVQERGQVLLPDVSQLDLRLRGGSALCGRVVDDASGAPVAGARVVFRATVYAELPRMLGYCAQAVTGEDGSFCWTDLPSGVPFMLWTFRDGYLASRYGRELLPAGLRVMPGLAPAIEVRMKRGAVVRGRVLRDDGSSVAGVLVDVFTRAGATIVTTEPATSDAAGAFRLLAQSGTALIRVRGPGVRQKEFPASPWTAVRNDEIPASCRVMVAADGETVIDVVVATDVTAPSRGVLSGTVRREDGTPLTGLLVELAPAVAGFVGSQGAFRFEGLAAGTYVLHVSAAGCASARIEGLVVSADGVKDGVDVVLLREMTISGRVVDESGAPVAGAELSVAPSSSSEPKGVAAAVSASDGGFVLGRLARGDVHVSVRAGGFASRGTPIAAGRENVEIRLDRALTISGTVVDAVTGAPIAGVPLRAEYSVFRGNSVLYREAGSDASGAFVLTDLAADSYRICIGPLPERSAWGVGEYLPTSVDGVRAGAEGVRVPVTRGLAIAGRVLDEKGRPAVGGVIDAILCGGQRTRTGDAARRARIRDDGTFRLAGLAPGAYDLAVGEDGRDPGPVRVERVEAGSSDVVVVLGSVQCIEGRLLLEDGTALAPGPGLVEVRWRGADGRQNAQQLPVVWDAAGRFRTNPLASDLVCDIVVSHVPGRLGAVVRGVRPGTRDLDIVVRTGGRIVGRVLDASGNAVPAGVPVAAHAVDADGSGTLPSEPGDYSFAKTGSDGRFELSRLGERAYRIAAGGHPSEFLEAGRKTPSRPGTGDVEIRLERGVSISGRLVDADGNGLRAGSVQASRHGGFVQVDESGRFVIRALVPGTHRLFAQFGKRIVDLGELQAPAEGVDLIVRDE